MSESLILLHQEALRKTHPVFDAAPAETKAIYVWDDAFFREANYGLSGLFLSMKLYANCPSTSFSGILSIRFDSSHHQCSTFLRLITRYLLG